jgi:lipopolysaccharide export LptBFGC system permease protein LptF
MKTLVLFISLFIGLFASPQSDKLPNQLRRIIDNAPDEFKNIRGGIKEITKNNDTVFFARVIVNGTMENIIEKSDGENSWIFTSIIDSSITKESKKNIKMWKKEIQDVLGDSFNLQTIDLDYGKAVGGAKGYTFTNENLSITLIYTYIYGADISHTYLTFKRIK